MRALYGQNKSARFLLKKAQIAKRLFFLFQSFSPQSFFYGKSKIMRLAKILLTLEQI